uniref:Galectin n=1 Tax=Haemonchus contortus TaxID=6289 RepID=A0A7I4Z689_HAECO
MHIYSEVRVPSIHPIHEELRSGCAINVHGRTKLGKKSQFTVELLSRSSTIMSLDFYAANDEVVATSCTNEEIEKIRAYQYYSSSVGRFHLHISVSDSYFDIEFNGRFVGCFVPAGDVRSVEAIGIKGDINVNIMTIEGFPLLKSWNTVWLEWTKDTFKQYGYPPVAGSQTSIDGDSSIPVSRSRSDSVSTEECTITMIHWKR